MKSHYSKTSYSQSTLNKAKELARLKKQLRTEKSRKNIKKAEAIKQQIITFINQVSYLEMEVISVILNRYEEEWNNCE